MMCAERVDTPCPRFPARPASPEVMAQAVRVRVPGPPPTSALAMALTGGLLRMPPLSGERGRGSGGGGSS